MHSELSRRRPIAHVAPITRKAFPPLAFHSLFVWKNFPSPVSIINSDKHIVRSLAGERVKKKRKINANNSIEFSFRSISVFNLIFGPVCWSSAREKAGDKSDASLIRFRRLFWSQFDAFSRSEKYVKTKFLVRKPEVVHVYPPTHRIH